MGKRGMSIRRSLSLLLALVMVIGLLPVSVFAAEGTYGLDDKYWKVEGPEISTNYLVPGDTTGEVTVRVKFIRVASDAVTEEAAFDMTIGERTLHSMITISGDKEINLGTHDEGVSLAKTNQDNDTLVFETTLTVPATTKEIETSGTWNNDTHLAKVSVPVKFKYEGLLNIQYKAGSGDAYDMPFPPSDRWSLDEGGYAIIYSKPARDGYRFVGWKCSVDDKTYNYGDTLPESLGIQAVGNTVGLTAQWTKDTDSEVTVKFDKNGTDAELLFANTMTVTKGEDFVIPVGCLPTRDGYKFAGWSADNGTIKYMPGSVISNVQDNITFKAQWTRENVQVSFSATLPNGVTASRKIEGVTYSITGVNDSSNVGKGTAVEITVQLPENYDASTLTVTANNVALQGKLKDNTTGTYVYSFRADSDTTVEISTPQEKTFTVALPLSEKYNAVFKTPDAAVGATTATVGYDGNYSFTVTPFAG